MPILGDAFLHDVFVSYSRGQGPGLREYSRCLIEDLERELRAFPNLGLGFSIFFDQSQHEEQGVNQMHPLTTQLEKAVRGSGVLVVLMSPHYLSSPRWCPDERSWWIDEQKANRRVGDGRIAVVKIWNNKDQVWPPELCDSRGFPLPGFDFFDPLSAAPQPFGWPRPRESESIRQYNSVLLKLVNRIAHQLESMRQELKAAEQRKTHADQLVLNPLVYLHGRAEQPEGWHDARSRLKSSGVEILPTSPPSLGSSPTEYQKQRMVRIETMASSDAVLLVGSESAAVVEADLATVGRMDRHSASSRAARNLPCALLDLHGLGESSPSLRDVARNLGVEWLPSANEGWPMHARDWLRSAGSSLGADQ